MVARREWTRRWWNDAGRRYELVTSPAVLDELAEGRRERSAQWLALVRDLPVLAVEPHIVEIVQAYVRHRVMPADPAGDALHLDQREQVRPYPARERAAWVICPGVGDATGAAWR